MSPLGSLDKGPVVISGSRRHALRWAGAFTAGSATAVVMSLSEGGWLVYVSFAAFLFCLFLTVLVAIRPGKLLITNSGFTEVAPLGRRSFAWPNVRDFRPHVHKFEHEIGAGPFGANSLNLILFDFDNGYVNRSSRRNRKAFGSDGSMFGGWDASSAEVAALLNEAKARWS